jgi:3-oxoacyl-[acyl-carrier protein] reductase
MQLHGKSAVLYGANNPTGAFVARAFADAGATVYLAGRTAERLQPLADEIVAAGGTALVAQVDPLDPKSVSEHLHQVSTQHGSVDVTLNLAFLGMEGPVRLCNLTGEQFAATTFTRVLSNFVTMAAASSEMAYQGRGTILATAGPGRTDPFGKLAGQAVGSAAIDALCQQLRQDVGSYGVRVAYLADECASAEDLVAELFRVLATEPPAPLPTAEMALESVLSRRSLRTEVPASGSTS